MAVDAATVKELRRISGAGMMDCKKALTESDGNIEEALRILREKGIKVASKRADRQASDGLVYAYIHGPGKLGVLVEVNCETDFVARTDEFVEFCKLTAMQIAASDPLYVSRDEVPEQLVEEERQILRKQLEGSGKPENILDKIVTGKLEKFYSEVCLLDQDWIHDAGAGTVSDVLLALVAKTGEKTVVNRFARFAIGT
jgi:elongation factor Ts